MKIDELKRFLFDANKVGYAGGEERKWIKEEDGSTTIPFEKGKWKMHDNFFGGEPYGGRTIVFFRDKPVWIMVYYGWVKEGVETVPVYKILRGALSKMPKEAPFRGSKKHKEDNFIYRNAWKGKVDLFSGEEKILKSGKLVYKANYLGGLIDIERGT